MTLTKNSSQKIPPKINPPKNSPPKKSSPKFFFQKIFPKKFLPKNPPKNSQKIAKKFLINSPKKP